MFYGWKVFVGTIFRDLYAEKCRLLQVTFWAVVVYELGLICTSRTLVYLSTIPPPLLSEVGRLKNDRKTEGFQRKNSREIAELFILLEQF